MDCDSVFGENCRVRNRYQYILLSLRDFYRVLQPDSGTHLSFRLSIGGSAWTFGPDSLDVGMHDNGGHWGPADGYTLNETQ